jgi:hypothetical protein
MLAIESPLPLFVGRDGLPLDAGYIYFGTVNLNPVTSPVTVYWDAAGTQPVAQPVRTSRGLIVRSGTPAKVYASGNFSMLVKDSSGTQVVYERNSSEWQLDSYVDALRADLASTSDASKGAGMVWFSSALGYLAGTVGYWLKTLVAWTQTGSGSVERSLSDRAKSHVELLDFVPVNLHASIADGTITTNLATYLQSAIESRSGPVTVLLPIGTTYATGPVYANKNGVRIVGRGPAVSKYKYVNAAGGTIFAGDSSGSASLSTYTNCALEDFEVIQSGSAATDASIVVDLTSFSYGHFDIQAQTRRANACVYYGQGNNGASPYYNHIESTGLHGHTDYTQTAFRFRGGSFAGGSNGPNANMIGPITRVASMDIFADIRVGQGNMFSQVGGESIGGAYFIFGGNPAVASGTSTGSNTGNTLKDSGAVWPVNAYVNGSVQITAGAGQGQVRTIKTNTGTALTLNEPWASIPDNTSQYSIFEGKALKNKVANVRAEGLSSLNPDFIYAHPGSDGTEFAHMSVESLGSGSLLQDYSGSTKNGWFGPHKQIITHTFTTPGVSANVNAWPRSGAFGGIRLPSTYVLEWVKAEIDGTSHGGVATITLDAGGGSVGAGDQTMVIGIPDGESQGLSIPLVRTNHIGSNTSLFLNLQTDGSFSAGKSVTVVLCVSFVQ